MAESLIYRKPWNYSMLYNHKPKLIFSPRAPNRLCLCTFLTIQGSIELDTPRGKKAWVNPILCKGDGLCNAKCPTHAIVLKHFTDDALFGQDGVTLRFDDTIV